VLNWFAKSRAEPGLMAVGIDAEAIRIAHIDRSVGERPVARHWASDRHQPKEEAGNLQRMTKAHGLDHYTCTTLLGLAEYQILLVDAPNVPRDELKAAIRWRIKDLLDYHVDDATVDVLEVPTDTEAAAKNRSMYAIAAPNEVVHKRISLFEQAGVPLKVIDIPEMAQRNIAALFEQPDRATALLLVGDWGGLLTISFRGDLVLARRLEVTWPQLLNADFRDHYFERIVVELQRSLDHFERQHHLIPLGELLLAPMPEDIGLDAYLGGKLGLPVRKISLGEVIDFADGGAPSGEDQWRYFHLFGAALRLEEKAL